MAESFGWTLARQLAATKQAFADAGKVFRLSHVAALIDRAMKTKAPARPRVKLQPDDEWLSALEKEPALAGVDVRKELGMAQFWCMNRGRVCSRKFFTSWLIKAEKIITVNGAGQSSRVRVAMDANVEPPTDWRAVLLRVYPSIDADAVKAKAWRDLSPDLRATILRAIK